MNYIIILMLLIISFLWIYFCVQKKDEQTRLFMIIISTVVIIISTMVIYTNSPVHYKVEMPKIPVTPPPPITQSPLPSTDNETHETQVIGEQSNELVTPENSDNVPLLEEQGAE